MKLEFSRFNHWVSVVMTRAHPLGFHDWLGMNKNGKNIKEEALFPIGDFANHHQPQSLDKSKDMISYNLKLYK
jgi:signal-transduction protein with cAMP-binding, CBS, and nucleotidyltransferase domain